MRQLSITPRITVAIGRHTRQYFAYVTTAPAELDLRKTVTLHQGPFSDVVGLAADPITHTNSVPTHQHAWCSSRHTSSPGNEPHTADTGTCCCARTLASSA